MSTNHTTCSLITPIPYSGTLQRPGAPNGTMWSVIDAATYFDLPPLIARDGTWAISREGIHCLVTGYEIPKDLLDKKEWIEHMKKKSWVNIRDFISIFGRAETMVADGSI